ncbi:MAG: DsbA family oxidoreductase [Pseudomonadota bacterium]
MRLGISIWSDIACPWCFVGKARLAQALELAAARGTPVTADIRWRAFELDPRPKSETERQQHYAERLANKLGRPRQEIEQMVATMAGHIRDAGLEADFLKLIPANTFDAHRLIQWAGDLDRQPESEGGAQQRVTEALMRGYLGAGLDLQSHEALLALVAGLEFDGAEAAAVLADGRYGERVRADEQEAQRLGISGVPFFVIDRYGLSGAQPPEAFLQVFDTVREERRSAQA